MKLRQETRATTRQSSLNVDFLKWVGKCPRLGWLPTVPYWLPAVTQEDRKMEGREREGGWGEREIKGVVMMRGHGPRGFLPLLSLICL